MQCGEPGGLGPRPTTVRGYIKAVKPSSTASSTWPAVMFANSRMASAAGLMMRPMISTGIMIRMTGIIPTLKGTPPVKCLQ